MNEPADFDLDKATADAWRQFQQRLAEVVSMIDPEGELTIGTVNAQDDGVQRLDAPYVRFECILDADTPPTGDTIAPASTGGPTSRRIVRAEAPSNQSLADGFQLSTEQLDQMVELGWSEPSAVGPHSSPNYTASDDQDHSEALAERAVATLRDVFGVQHPVFLAPDQLAEVLQDPTPQDVATVHEPASVVAHQPRNAAELTQWVIADLADLFGHPPFQDRVGDIAIRVGSTVVFVRVTSDAREVLIFSILVHDVEGRSRAVELLNDLNTESRYGRFALHRDRVFMSMSVLAQPFVAHHLRTAVRIMSELADGLDDDLARKLRGRTTFTAGDDAA